MKFQIGQETWKVFEAVDKDLKPGQYIWDCTYRFEHAIKPGLFNRAIQKHYKISLFQFMEEYFFLASVAQEVKRIPAFLIQIKIKAESPGEIIHFLEIRRQVLVKEKRKTVIFEVAGNP